MKKLHGERNSEWLGRVDARLAEIERELAALPPEKDFTRPGTEFEDVEANPRTALEEEQVELQHLRLTALEVAQRDGDR